MENNLSLYFDSEETVYTAILFSLLRKLFPHTGTPRPIARQIVPFFEQTNSKAWKITNKVKISVEKLCTDQEIFIGKILYFRARDFK